MLMHKYGTNTLKNVVGLTCRMSFYCVDVLVLLFWFIMRWILMRGSDFFFLEEKLKRFEGNFCDILDTKFLENCVKSTKNC